MPDFDPTPEQQAILAHDPDRHARVLAGPGTGKSATLVALVDQLLAGAPRPRTKLLTFTRAATAELAKKVSAHPAAAAARPSTIHSFAISVLLQNPGAGDFPRPLRIPDRWEEENIVRPTLAKRAGVTTKRVEKHIREMAANWESLRPERDPRIGPRERARFVGAWQEHRQIYGYTLLAELPYALRAALRDHPDLEGIDYDLLIVDEYQDLNACDLEVLKRIAERDCSVIGAGDDDQSIYSFRKAAPEGIRRFPEDYAGSADYPLSVTQRCGKQIIRWGSFVIEGDPERPQEKPRLTSAEGCPEGEVALLSFAGEKSEADGVASLVQRLRDEEDIPPSEILVLLRSDYQGRFSKPIKECLRRRNIPYFDPDAVDEMLGEPRNRRVLEIFRLLVHRHDSIAWASLLSMTEGVGKAFFDYIYKSARQEHCQFGEALLDAYRQGFPAAPAAPARRALELINSVLGWLDAHAPPEQPDGGWGRWIIETAGDSVVPPPSEELRELLLALDELAEPEQGLRRYLGQIAPLGRDRALAQSQGVRIMTMTGAKGLTVRATIVAALEEGLVPRPDSDLGEERRLLYVGMTRAKEFLFCTWARRRRGQTAHAGAGGVAILRRHSSFLDGGPVESKDGAAFIRRRWR